MKIYLKLAYYAIIVALIVFIGWKLPAKKPSDSFSIKGITFAAPPEKTGTDIFQEIVEQTAANYVALVPYAFQNEENQLLFNTDRQWRGETEAGILESVRAARSGNLKIMIKPQIWRHRGLFTGDIDFTTEEEWQQFESQYYDYIMLFAKLAAAEGVELFSIGNELKAFVQKRPEFWITLIKDIRKIYPGKMVYSANWDNYENIPFWDKLDFIGVNAYFPLCKMQTPTPDCLDEGWRNITSEINKLSRKHNKAVIFTEVGYRNIDFTAQKPWESYTDVAQNNEGQANAIKSAVEIVKREPAIIGLFIWKWELPFRDYARERNDFNIRGKIAAKVIKEQFVYSRQ